MSADPAFEYGYARASARLAARPDERLWRQLRSARSLLAAIDAVRATPAAAYVAGVPGRGGIDEVELGFRQHLRGRIREAAAWAPPSWRPALLWTETLIDLPALQQLLADEAPPAWLRNDPHLAPLVAPDRLGRRARIAQSALAPLAAVDTAPARRARTAAARRAADPLHPLLHAWQKQWQSRWPRCSGEQREALRALQRLVRSHVAAFAALPLEATAPSRERLVERLRRFLRQAAAQPAALFAYLLLVALDVERLRGEFVLRAVGGPWFGAESS